MSWPEFKQLKDLLVGGTTSVTDKIAELSARGVVKSVQRGMRKGVVDEPVPIEITINTINPDKAVCFVSGTTYATSGTTNGNPNNPIIVGLTANKLSIRPAHSGVTKLYSSTADYLAFSWQIIEFY